MVELSFFDKIKMFFNTAISSPFFLVLLVLSVILIILMVLDALKFKKMHRNFYLTCWLAIVALLIFKYGKYIVSILDNLFEKIFQALYFPNYIVYTFILLISNIYFLFVFFKKNVRKSFRVIGVINMLLINILFVMILEVVISNNIDIYDDLSVYTNSQLLVWLQLSTAIFTSMLLIYLLQAAYYKAKRYDKTGVKYSRKLPPIVFDDIEKKPEFTKKDKVIIWKKLKM